MMKQFFFICALTFGLASAMRADVLNLSGDTTGAPTFVRPTETGARSFFTVHYNVLEFNVASSGPFTFTLDAIDPASYDTFIHLFVGSFDPADLSDPAMGFLAANDDRSLSTTNSGLTNINLNAGTNYFLVIDGFLPSDAGGYAASISGNGAIIPVPEPSSMSLMILCGGLCGGIVRARVLRARRRT